MHPGMHSLIILMPLVCLCQGYYRAARAALGRHNVYDSMLYLADGVSKCDQGLEDLFAMARELSKLSLIIQASSATVQLVSLHITLSKFCLFIPLLLF